MKSPISAAWIKRFKRGPFHHTPTGNFAALDGSAPTLFSALIKGNSIDLYVYNADSGDLIFGRANLDDSYPRELAHHIGLVNTYLALAGKPLEKFSQGSLDIAVDHSKKKVYFKHLTVGLQDMIFPEELEWVTHIGSLQSLAMKALQEIGMPESYHKSVVKAKEWARLRTGLMRGREIPYEEWKKQLKGDFQ